MKSIVFAIAMLSASFSFADERVFDCSATQLNKSADIPAELNIQNNPNILFRHGLKQWSLRVGDLVLDTRDLNGPALWLDVDSTPDTVSYTFSVEGSSEYELEVSVVDYSAKVYYWGLGEKIPVGAFTCDIVEQ